MDVFSDITPPLSENAGAQSHFWDWWLLGVVLGFLAISIATYFIVYAILKPSSKKENRQIKCNHCGNAQPGFISVKRNISFLLAVAFAYLLVVLVFVAHALPSIIDGTFSSLDYTILSLIIAPFLWLLELAVIIRSFPKTKAICPNCGQTWTL